MQLEIITPDKSVYKGEVSSATFPGTKGSFQVLNNHAPLVSTLGKGKLTYKGGGQQTTLMVEGGVVEVKNNHIVVLAEKILD